MPALLRFLPLLLVPVAFLPDIGAALPHAALAAYALMRSRGMPKTALFTALCPSEREDNAPPPMVETAPWGYVRLRLETYPDSDFAQWAKRLAATAWQQVYVYFMHEPTAPGYAQALMKAGHRLERASG